MTHPLGATAHPIQRAGKPLAFHWFTTQTLSEMDPGSLILNIWLEEVVPGTYKIGYHHYVTERLHTPIRSYRIPNTRKHYTCNVEFQDPDAAMLFKLTWINSR